MMDLSGPVAAFEVFVSDLPAEKKRQRARGALALQNLLPVRRDFAFVVDRSVSAGDVVKAVLASDKAMVAGANVFDVYEGKGIADGKKSLAVEVTLQPADKTLTDGEIEALSGKIIGEVKRATGGDIRG
jgi:phenylalanyl-tRNA synthetase beta chain